MITINFVLQYWFIAAVLVAGWAFFKFITYPRCDAPKAVEKDKVLKVGGASKDVEKQIQKIVNSMK
jgi:hypothetical protein